MAKIYEIQSARLRHVVRAAERRSSNNRNFLDVTLSQVLHWMSTKGGRAVQTMTYWRILFAIKIALIVGYAYAIG